MYTSGNFAQYQSLDLSNEIAIINPQRTPFLTYLLTNGKATKAESNIINWYEETLNTNAIKTSKEGADAPAEVEDSTALLNNYTELLTGTARVSNTAQASTIVGVSDLMAREVNKKLTLLKYSMEDRMIKGTKAAKTESAGQKMDGLLNLINTGNSITSSSNVLTEPEWQSLLKKMYDSGTNDNMICLIDDINKRALNAFVDVKYLSNYDFLGFTCQRYHSEYGDVTFVLEPSLAGTKSIVIVNPDYLEFPELQPAQAIDLAVTGDSIAKMVKWEGTLKLSNSKAAAKLVLA